MEIGMLKEYLGEELFAQAQEKLNGVEGLQVIAAHDGTWLPKARLDEEIGKRRELQAELEEARRQAQESGALQEKIARLQEELEHRERSAALREALAKAGARDAELVEKLLEGAAGDAAAQIAALKKRSPYLFEQETDSGRAGFGGWRAAGGGHGQHADVNGVIRAAAGR